MTKYNSKQYFINDISFDLTPTTHKFEWVHLDPQTGLKETVVTNMIDYFWLKWGQRIDSHEAH